MRPSTDRIAYRYLLAREFDTEEALEKYLKDHPNADKTKHTVKKDDDRKKKDEDGPKPKLRSPFKGVSQERVSKVIEENKADFDKLVAKADDEVAEAEKDLVRDVEWAAEDRDKMLAVSEGMLAGDDTWKDVVGDEDDRKEVLADLISEGELPAGATEEDLGKWVINDWRESMGRLAKEQGMSIEEYVEWDANLSLRTAEYKKKQWDAMTDGERRAVVLGPAAGELFEKRIAKDKKLKRYQKRYMQAWIRRSDHIHSHRLHGLMESLGISGTPSRRDLEDDQFEDCDPECVARHRATGAKSEDLRKYAEEVYAFQQAFYQHLGLDEITVWRGTGSQASGKAVGEEMSLRTRELSSWSTDAGVAAAFGRVLETKIPVSQVFASYATFPDFKGEGEVIVMGSSDLTVRVDSPREIRK